MISCSEKEMFSILSNLQRSLTYTTTWENTLNLDRFLTSTWQLLKWILKKIYFIKFLLENASRAVRAQDRKTFLGSGSDLFQNNFQVATALTTTLRTILGTHQHKPTLKMTLETILDEHTPALSYGQDLKKAETKGQWILDPFCILILGSIVKTSKHWGNLIFENSGF